MLAALWAPEGDRLAQQVFTDFPDVLQQSSILQRQLGMLQASGVFLDLAL